MSFNVIRSLLKVKTTYLNRLFFTSVTGLNESHESVTETQISPLIITEEYSHLRTTSEEPRQAWIESLTSIKDDKVGLFNLHPEIFGFAPRLDIIHQNVTWQRNYREVNYNHARVPPEMRGPGKGLGRKPWPQKGTGRARQGSVRSPQWKKGGTLHGPRMYMTKFYMLSFHARVLGLISALSCKFIQDDLKVVQSLDLPSADPDFLNDLVDKRMWGPSVLFVNLEDMMPENITEVSEEVGHFNLLPVYGLNVYSMLKHDTVVVTVPALKKIQERLIYNLFRPDYAQKGSEEYKH